ncbi:MAG: protein translocase subunit SecDF [Bacteroidales bacterium]|nr:protein translocase subunit SecDF [Bacteroidales bacterium]
MRNKGAILTLVIAFTLVCIYQLSFTWKGESVKKKAREYAGGDIKKEERYLDSMSNQVVYNILVSDFTFREVQEREINLGLDLRGGMSVILEISTADIIRSLAADQMMIDDNMKGTMEKVLTEVRKQQQNSNDDYLTIFGEVYDRMSGGIPLAVYFDPADFEGDFDRNSPNEDVLAEIRKESEGAIDRAFEIIRNRIDQFGVAQPNIQRLETNRDRILVELPGVKNRERVKNLLQGTANLEFWGCYLSDDFDQVYFKALDAQLGRILESQPDTATAAVVADAVVEIDSNTTTTTDAQQTGRFGVTGDDKVSPKATGADRMSLSSLLEFTDLDGSRLARSRPEIAKVHLRDTGDVNRLLRVAFDNGYLESDAILMWGSKPIVNNNKIPTDYIYLYIIKGLDGKPLLEGNAVQSARQDFDEQNASAYVTMTMKPEGTTKWAQITAANIGKPIAIVMDSRVYSAPTVQNEIRGGSSKITGDFTINEANDLANLLKAGKLPARAHVIQENVVGPSLGKKAVSQGLNSFLIAFLIILLYMVLYYSRKAGLVADIALIANMFFIMGVLASLGAALTLPGIAGIILTIGMSVDANVLIFERVREEMASGKGVRMALADGYKNAYSAIIDANVTTLITGIILYLVGTGPIKGFATTLIIGILTSLFSAIFITRLIFEAYLKRNKDIQFDTSITRNAFKNINFAFIQKSKVFYSISIVIMLISIGSLVIRGLDYGVDFTGGRNFVVKLDKQATPAEIAGVLQKQFGEAPKVITYGDDLRITTQFMIDSTGENVDREIQELLYAGLKPYLDEKKAPVDTLQTETDSVEQKGTMAFIDSYDLVGPSIADDIKRQAIYAITLALVFIFLYVLLRFRNWQFGLGALAALVHDALIVLGIFSLLYRYMPFSLEIDQSFIAAILTVVGYSINDTVVIFDRIREYVKEHPKRDRKEIMNMALNSTLSRTFSTSFSTFIVLLAIFIFGGEVIRGFVFALMVGIVVGTYSSLFIATPVVYHTIKRSERKKNK